MSDGLLTAIAAALAVAVFGYLLYTLLRPERF
jgi:K+-transporting ATPase KdpF subunit